MKTCRRVVVFLAVAFLSFSLFGSIRAQASQKAMQTFFNFDSPVLGIEIQANATAEARPEENITVILNLTSLTDVHINNFSLSIFGFLNGTDRILMANRSYTDFWLNSTSQSYNCTFQVPDWISGKAYGEIELAHSAMFANGTLVIINPGLVSGFYMTSIENVYLEELEQEYSNLTQQYGQLNQSYTNLGHEFDNLTQLYEQLNRSYVGLQGSANELASTRQVTAVLGITTVIFVATTLYLALRKPKQYW
jgi:hypothetical protein